MITVISPAKTLDFETPSTTQLATTPAFLNEAQTLIRKLRTVSKKRLMGLMDISQELAALNVERYIQFEEGQAAGKSKQAVLAFNGDVYLGLEAAQFDDADLAFAQTQLRILSGLYGLLRPLDQIQPYRLEMGTQLAVGRNKNLYRFWNTRIAQALNAAMLESSGDNVLINLASQEYFGAVDTAALQARVVTPVFLDRKGEQYKVVSFWAKKARGKMAAWIIGNRIDRVEDVKRFSSWGYAFNPTKSTKDQWAFTRESPE